MEGGILMSGMDRDEHLNRERGFLGETGKEFLLGVSDVDPESQHARNIRARIRKRTMNAMLDFDILNQHLQERDRDQIFEFTPDRDMEDFRLSQVGITSMLAFLYETAKRNNQSFEEWIEQGIHRIEKADSDSTVELSPVDVDVEIQQPQEIDVSEVRQKFVRGDLEDITSAELLVLIWMEREGKLDGAEQDLEDVFDSVAEDVERAWRLSEIAEGSTPYSSRSSHSSESRRG